MRVDVYDESGNRYTISFEGRVTRDKALRILDIVELLGGMPNIEPELNYIENMTKTEKIEYLVKRQFPLVWFSAKDAQKLYEKEIDEKISLSAISTFLSRLSNRGLLLKSKNFNKVLYRSFSQDIKGLIKSR
jgi:hypothetical protein